MIQKREEEKNILYVKKRFKIDTKDNAEINNAMLTRKLYDSELIVLKRKLVFNLDFATTSWLPYKFINSFIENLISLDYINNIQLIIDFSQLFAKFSYYDSDHHNKLINALHSISFSEIRFVLLFEIFVLAISNPKIDKRFLESSYENLSNMLRPYLEPDTPSNFKKPLTPEELEQIYEKLIEYYNKVLMLKNNANFKANSSLFKQIACMVFQIQENITENHINPI